MLKIKVILLLSIVFHKTIAQTSSGESQINASKIQVEEAIRKARNLIQPYLKIYPGISIAVGMDEEIIWSEGFGFGDVSLKEKVSPEHQFRFYSLSKSITGLALAKLIASGQLDINAGVRQYLPNLPLTYDRVKVRHLINHTSGVRHYNKGEWIKISKDHCETTESAINTFIHDELASMPGEKYAYSSFGYVLLSHLIAEVSGQSYGDYIHQVLFQPIGIGNIAMDRSVALTNEVSYYSKWNAKKEKGRSAIEVDNTCKFGGGSYVGTAEDLVKLYLSMLNKEILTSESIEQYFSEIPTDSGQSTQYAFGIGDVTNSEGVRYHGHSGSAVGARSVLIVYPDIKMVIVILTNSNDEAINRELGSIAALFREVSR